MTSIRNEMRGYHLFIIAVVDGHLSGKNLSNLFAYGKSKSGLGVTTTANVADVIIPSKSMHAYYLFRLARHAMNFIAPNHSNHTDTRRCVYDAKINKMDIRLSMGSGALCDDCREALLAGEPPISATQFNALNMLFAESGRLLDRPPRTLRVFIGSSSEGLGIANKIQTLLHHDFAVEVWNQNTVFELGNATLEDLEAAVLKYDFGIFVCTADDKLESRGETKSVARDNVLFEYGLFSANSPGSEPSLSEARQCHYQVIWLESTLRPMILPLRISPPNLALHATKFVKKSFRKQSIAMDDPDKRFDTPTLEFASRSHSGTAKFMIDLES